MIRRMLLLFLFLASVSISFAQAKKKIRKDGRGNKGESQFALSKNDFQAEWEVGHEIVNGQLGVVTCPNIELHHGLSDRLGVNTELSQWCEMLL